MRDVRKYDVFQLAERLVLDIYKATAGFPKEEMFGLTAQMRRAAASIPMNLVEDAARSGEKEFCHFVNIAIGSCEEARYQLHLVQRLGYLADNAQRQPDTEYENVKMMLTKLLAAVSSGRNAAIPRHED